MRVIETRRYGGPEVLEEVERPDPASRPGRVRVRVTAVPVSPVDLWTRAGRLAAMTPGLEPPFVLGWEFAGTVLEDAEGFAAGRPVVGMIPWFAVAGTGVGAYAEVVSAEPGWLAPVPAGLDPVPAATLGMNGQTAAQSLDLAGLRPGDTVLVTGASGLVGAVAVQLAVAAGAHVLAVAAGPDDEPYLAGLGAKQVLPRTAPADLAAAVRAVHPAGVDALFDAAVLGPPAIGAVRDGGVFVSATGPAAPPPERGIRVESVRTEPDPAQLAELLDALAGGRLSTRVAGTLPLSEAAEAHRRLAAGGLRGKLILTP